MKLSEIKVKAPKILIYGPAGTGKTACALTLGSRAHVVDMDDGLLTGLTLQDKWSEDRQQVDVVQFLEEDPRTARAFLSVKKHLMDVVNKARQGKWEFDALVIDSLTAMAEFAMRSVLASNGMLGNVPQIQHWQLAFTEVENIMIILRAMPCPVILIAHDQVRTIDEQDYVRIAIPGKNMPTKITRYFDEVFYSKVKTKGGGKREYLLQTRASGSIEAKSRGNLEALVDTSIGMTGILKLMGYEFTKQTVSS